MQKRYQWTMSRSRGIKFILEEGQSTHNERSVSCMVITSVMFWWLGYLMNTQLVARAQRFICIGPKYIYKANSSKYFGWYSEQGACKMHNMDGYFIVNGR